MCDKLLFLISFGTRQWSPQIWDCLVFGSSIESSQRFYQHSHTIYNQDYQLYPFCKGDILGSQRWFWPNEIVTATTFSELLSMSWYPHKRFVVVFSQQVIQCQQWSTSLDEILLEVRAFTLSSPDVTSCFMLYEIKWNQ